MADVSHLERMGRELKCPICLSLLNSAVSLTCNHVFCNLCIEKSMKLASSCPVCKVPYGRREVRPAPHMDNLVNIYKCMEVASGVNIFVTQSKPSQDNRPEGAKCERKEKRRGKNRPQNSSRINQGNMNGNVEKPSFPIKKRVQVPQCPPSQDPDLRASFSHGLESIVLKDNHTVNSKGEPVLTPFFWLRDEEDAERLSQQTDPGENMDTQLNAPCFSDIKDSDDENPSKISPNEEKDATSNKVDYYDSEMFEWTQRPCSPELCSSPIKTQVEVTDEFEGVPEKGITLSSISGPTTGKNVRIGNKENVVPEAIEENVQESVQAVPFPRTRRSATVKKRSKRANYDGKSITDSTKNTQVPKSRGEEVEVPVVSWGNAESTIIKECKKIKLSSHNGSTTGCERDENKENVVPEVETHYMEESLKAMPIPRTRKSATVKNRAKRAKMNSENIADSMKKPRVLETKGKEVEVPVVSGKKFERTILKEYKANVRSLDSNRPILKSNKKVMFENSLIEHVPGNVSASSIEANDLVENGMVLNLPVSPAHIESNSKKNILKKRDCSGKSQGKNRRNIRCDHEPTQRKKQKTSTDVLSEVNKSVVYDGLSGTSSRCKVKYQLPTLNRGVLHKCQELPSKIKCAFCHSSEDSEATGDMVHYYNGKPVPIDYNGGSKVIHAHRNCTEWAPKVYFEDDNAINLEAEVTRSRRIKCCCCDIKGAALGCYETGCRKSFHVPCAKLVPQCRWDNDNFVMLCPLHVSSKLPNEVGGCEIKKKKCLAKRTSQSHQPENAVKDASNMNQSWKPRGSSGNFVFCCSALANEEKDIVSKFQRSSGVAVLKNWDSKITHVIASTDENGACRRTLKFLMGILEGKWILSVKWIEACLETMEYVDEQPYEVGVDIHGIRDGPRLGRMRVLNKLPKLFDGFKFYLTGDFVQSYKGYLHDLLVAAGGTVLQRKPIPIEPKITLPGDHISAFIIYSLELPDKCDPNKKNVILNQRRSEAEALASSTGAMVATNSWVLNSIAAGKLQNLEEK